MIDMRQAGKWTIFAALIATMATDCRGIDLTWRNPISGLFQNPSRWSPQQIPGAADRTIFAQSLAYTVSFNASVANQQSVVSTGSVIWSLAGNAYSLTGAAGSTFELGLDVTGVATPTTLTVRGGQVSTFGARLDGSAGGNGLAIIESGATLSVNSEALVVGDFGAGSVQVQAGGALNSDFAVLAFEDAATAAATVSGSGARWNNTQGATIHPLRVGSGGDALLSVSGGGRVDTGQLIVADLQTSTSAVTISGAGSQLTATDYVFAGYEGIGQVQVTAGGLLTSLRGELGSRPASQGTVIVSGTNSLWNMTGALNVGFEGAGMLTVDAGGRVTSALSILGQEPTGTGHAVITGAGSRWDLTEQIQVGQDGAGTLSVLGGATLTSLKAASSSGSSGILGAYDLGEGTAVVSGTGSLWSGDGTLQVGFNGHGDLSVTSGGVVSHNAVALARNSGAQGSVTVAGSNSRLQATTFLSVGGSSSAAGGIGSMMVESGATVSAGAEVTVWPAGHLTTAGGKIEAPLVRVSQGTLNGGGMLTGDVSSSGIVRADNPATPLTIGQDYDQTAEATLEIAVSAAGAGRLSVAGSAHWDGALRVVSSDGCVPPPGTVLTAATFASSSGAFDVVATMIGPEAQDFFALLPMGNSLSLYAPLIGDANFDGLVSGADYTIWNDHFDEPGGWADGDFNGDGLVTGGDYTLWADHFGESTDFAAAITPAPEPSALASASAALIGWALAAARRRSRPRRPPGAGRRLAHRRWPAARP